MNAVPPVGSSTKSKASQRGHGGKGDLTLTLSRQQWNSILGALSIAAADLARRRSYEQMFEYGGLCSLIGQRLGATQQTSAGGDLPPPPLTRAAGA